MTIGIGGWGSRRKPMALVREILRSPLKDLTLVSYGGPDVGLLCAAGQGPQGRLRLRVARFDPARAALPQGARRAGAIEALELDEGMLQWGLYAAALRLPFLPTRAGLGSDVMKLNPELRTVRSPYADGEELVAMPALELDVALVHMNRADARGNGAVPRPRPRTSTTSSAWPRSAASCRCERIVATRGLPRRPARSTRCASAACWSTAWSRRRAARTSPSARPTTAATRPSSASTPRRAKSPEAWQAFQARYLDARRTRRPTRAGGASATMSGRRRAPRSAPSRSPSASAATARSWPARSACCPTLGARLAKLTFAPDLLITDGVALRARERAARSGAANGFEPVVEGWMPYPQRLRPALGGPPPRDDGRDARSIASATRTSPASAIRSEAARRSCSACAARPATRSTTRPATGSRTTRPQSFVDEGRRRLGRRLRPRRGARAEARALPRDPPRRLEPRRLRLRDARPRDAARLRASRGHASTRWWRTPASSSRSRRRRARDARAHAPTSCACCASVLDPDRRRRDREVRWAERCTPPSTPRSATGSACRYPIIQTGMGWVATPELVAAACERGRLRLPRRGDAAARGRSTPRSRR